MTLFALVLCGLLGLAASAFAAEDSADPAESYGIEITCCFNDEETANHSLSDCQENTFLLMDEATGQYILAKYSRKAGGYVLSGFAEDKAAATYFHCGVDRNEPEKLLILGLPEGRFVLTQEETKEGYLTLGCDTVFSFSSGRSVVTLPGYTVDNQCHFASLRIVNAKGIHLPMGDPLQKWNYDMFGFDILLAAGIALVLVGTTGIFTVLIIGRKKACSSSGKNLSQRLKSRKI